jgi:ELWxxDGT repeat protein
VQAGPPAPLADINQEPGTLGSNPSSFVPFRDRLYFLATDSDHGIELWRTDGTPEGTELFAEILAGPGPDQPFHTADANYLAVAEGWLYFRAWDPAHGEELWRTDGTVQGTSLFADVWPGPGSGAPGAFAPTPTGLYFVARDPEHGLELRRVREGRVEPIDIVPGPAGSYPQSLTAVGERAFFTRSMPGLGQQLWTTDGTTTQAVEGAPLNPDTPLTAALGKVFFTIYKPQVETLRQLWVVDGATLATSALGEFASVVFDRNPGDPLYFSAHSKLCRTNGTPTGTTCLFDNEGRWVEYPLSVAGTVYARAYWEDTGYELLRYDGNQVTRIDIVEGSTSSYPYVLAGAGGGVYFSYGSTGSRKIGWTDGAGLQTVGEFPESSIAAGGVLGERTVFLLDDGSYGREPWVSTVVSGVASPAALLKDIRTEPHGSDPSLAVALTIGGKVSAFFTACADRQRCRLWQTDGATTSEVPADPQFDVANPIELTALGERLYFLAGSSHGLYWTDGMSGTHRVELPAVSEPPGSIEAAGTNLFFSFNRGLWRVDTQDPSAALPVWSPSYGGVADLVAAGNSLYFRGWDSKGESVFVTDGTTVTRLEPDGADAYLNPYFLTPVETRMGTRVFFYAYAGATGAELWATDGTVEGTALVRDINTEPDTQYPGYPGSSKPDRLTAVGDTLFFTAWEPEHGRELWKSDGTTSGTVLVKDITDEPATEPVGDYATSSTYRELIAMGRTLLFTTWTAELGTELWKSDGTEAGTTVVRDIVPGPGSASPGELTASGRTAFFAAWDPDHGRELWQTDGTEQGTTRIADLAPGGRSSSPSELSLVGGSLLFSANVDPQGREPWRLAIPEVRIEKAQAPEGGTAPLVAYASDPGGAGLTFHWDMDGDGVYEVESAGDPTATFSAAGIDGPASAIVRVRATDAGGVAAVDEAWVEVANVAPVVEAGPAVSLVVGQALARQESFTDFAADTWTATVDYGEGSGPADLALSGRTFTLAHCYATAGTYTVTVKVTDDDGGVGADTFVVVARTAVSATQDLIGEIEDLIDDGALGRWLGNSLLVELRLAQRALEAGDEARASIMLRLFVFEVSALKRARILEPGKADELVGDAQGVIDSLGGGGCRP